MANVHSAVVVALRLDAWLADLALDKVYCVANGRLHNALDFRARFSLQASLCGFGLRCLVFVGLALKDVSKDVDFVHFGVHVFVLIG